MGKRSGKNHGRRTWYAAAGFGMAAAAWLLGRAAARAVPVLADQADGTVKEESPRVALTFDDGPSAYTEELSAGLRDRGVAATFFLLGENVSAYPESVAALSGDGHLLGNHSYSHVQLTALSADEARREILKTNNLIYRLSGVYPVYLRPPYGSWDDRLELCVEMIPVFWDVDSLDWKLLDAGRITEKVLGEVQDGDVILMHDGYRSSLDAAFAIADRLLDEGWEFVTADRMMED